MSEVIEPSAPEAQATAFTEDQLRAAWQRAGLARTGWSFERVLAAPALRHCLEIAVQRAQRAGRPLPTQPRLI